MFRTRLISGIVLVAATIALMILGGYPLFIVITVISFIGLFEIYRAVGVQKTFPAIVGYVSGVGIDIFLFLGWTQVLLFWLIATVLVWMIFYVITWPKIKTETFGMLFFGLVYVVIFLSFVFQTRYLEDGIYLVWFIYIGAWGADTSAYCVGKLIGRHKLPTALSPNKTIEGCVGGIVGAAVIGFVFACIFFGVAKSPKIAIICAVAAVFSEIGDLTASAIKRDHNIKDYGKLIPGHGGILDRFDSILFIAPIVYCLLRYWGI